MLPEDLKPSDFPIPFGRYTLLETLGKGASGQVFLAEMQGAAGFRKRVALKIMKQQFEGDEEHFVREGRLCGLLNHRNVMDTYEFGVLDNQAFISMEFIDGVTLGTLCRLGPLPPSIVLEVGIHICRGLAYAHELNGADGPLGLVHRDIKPSNILIGWDGSVKVADFGIAILTSTDKPADHQSWMGSPGYMSPEQWNQGVLDARSDVFSLCVVLYQMCTGQRLIKGDGIDGRRDAALNIDRLIEDTDTLLSVDTRISGLGQVLARGLRLHPDDRSVHATALGNQLRQLQRTVDPEPSLEHWLVSTLDKQEQNWGNLGPVGASPAKPIDIEPVSPATLKSPRPGEFPHTIAGSLVKLQGSSTLEEVLEVLNLVDQILADLPTHQRKGHLESVQDTLVQAGLPLVRHGDFPYLIADRKTGRYWYKGKECIQLRPGSLSERFLYAVATRGPELSRDALYEQVWEQPYLPPSSDTVLRVRAHKVRSELAPLGLTIERHGEGQYVVSGMPGVLSWEPETASVESSSAELNERLQKRSTNIEAPPNAFFGRTDEMEELTRLHTQHQAVVTVLGPPGTGKTRLTKQWARARLKAGEVQSAWFCDLSASITTAGVLGAVARTLGVQLTGPEQTEDKLIAHLGYAIAGRDQTLVMLDNAEQVSTEVRDILKQWCTAAPDARFVVTSRVPLGLKAEKRLRLKPLPVPTEIDSLSTLAENDAAALFVERAQAVHPGFSLDDHNADTIAAIVTRLDGLPLAIELAAARSCVLSPSQLLDRLSERFKLLKGGKSPRQETLESAIQWSWDLLEPWEQAALAQLSVFQDGFFIEPAEAVLDLSAWPAAPWSLDVVESLLDKSLIYSRKVLDAPRFGMYMSIQEYASEKLETGPWPEHCGDMVKESRLRHATHFAQMGTEKHLSSLKIHGGLDRGWRLRREVENLIAGAQIGLEYKVGDVAANCAIAAAKALQWRPPADALLMRVQDTVQLEAPMAARLLGARGKHLHIQRNFTAALQEFDQAVAIYRELGNIEGEATTLLEIASIHRLRLRWDEALDALEQAVVLGRESGNRFIEGLCLAGLGVHASYIGKPEEAKHHLKQKLVLDREQGNRGGEGHTLSNLGAVACEAGDFQEALEYLTEGLLVVRELGHQRHEASVLNNLGLLHIDIGQPETARSLFEQALPASREAGARDAEGVVLGNLGGVLLEAGEKKTAELYLRMSIEMCSPVHVSSFRATLAKLRAQEGRYDEARSLIAESEIQAKGMSPRWAVGFFCKKAQVEHIAGDLEAAHSALLQAKEIAAAVTPSRAALDQLIVQTSQMLSPATASEGSPTD